VPDVRKLLLAALLFIAGYATTQLTCGSARAAPPRPAAPAGDAGSLAGR
jgi:hypothetical protein